MLLNAYNNLNKNNCSSYISSDGSVCSQNFLSFKTVFWKRRFDITRSSYCREKKINL